MLDLLKIPAIRKSDEWSGGHLFDSPVDVDSTGLFCVKSFVVAAKMLIINQMICSSPRMNAWE